MDPLQPAVVLAGRFQPFHRGHHAAYRWLVDRFGAERVWLASSGRTEEGGGRPAPFGFEEKRRLITTLFAVPAERVVRIRSPYAPKEVLAALDPDSTSYVAAVGARDADRLKSRYWAPFPPDGPWEPYPRRGYVLVVPALEDDLSATAIRALLGDPALPLAEKEAAFRGWYPRWDADLFQLLVTRLTPPASR